jgi:L-malate glycosyltransferase
MATLLSPCLIRDNCWFLETLFGRMGAFQRTQTPELASADCAAMGACSTADLPSALRVVLVGPSLRRLIGGQEVQANLLLQHWQDDPDVAMNFVPTDLELPQWLSRIEAVPYARTLARLPFYLASLWRAVGRSDIVHIFSASYSSFLVATTPAWIVARVRRRKTVINYRDGRARDHLQRSRVARLILRHTRQLVTPSGYLVDVFKEFGMHARIVPNVVDLREFTYRHRTVLQPVLLCTRNFEAHYGVDLVIRAFTEVKKKFPDALLRLVGKGPEEPAIRALVRELQLEGVEFLGPVPRDKIARVYAGADIFVNASWVDNLPGSILEAFASGTPVVTTSAGGIPYMLKHEETGLMCEPGDWRSLANHILRLLQDPTLARRLAAAAVHEASRYTWTNVRGQWIAVYRS